MLLGLCAGFARYVSIDPNLVRLVLVVVTTWSLGLGALLYLVVAVFVPEDP